MFCLFRCRKYGICSCCLLEICGCLLHRFRSFWKTDLDEAIRRGGESPKDQPYRYPGDPFTIRTRILESSSSLCMCSSCIESVVFARWQQILVRGFCCPSADFLVLLFLLSCRGAPIIMLWPIIGRPIIGAK